MSRFSSHRTAYPHHWPVHPQGMQASAPLAPEGGSGTAGFAVARTAVSGSAVAVAVAVAVTPSDRGKLTAAPWLGLHYETEGA